MITKDDIKNLANLARIEVSDSEADGLVPEIDSILGYVGQIKNASADVEKNIPKLRNILRDDIATNLKGEYAEKLLENAPSREGTYLKVKKIL